MAERTENGDHVSQVVRAGDPDRWLTTLFAPADVRADLLALYAFSHEIARVRDVVSDPMPGEIRMQWWRDLIQGESRGDVRANPLAAALDDAIVRNRLPRSALVDLIDARVFDLYDDPMPTMADLEGYCGETSSALVRLASLILARGEDPGFAEAAGHAGVAFALVGLMRALPWHARRGQVYLPASLLSEHGLSRDDIVAGRSGPGLDAVLGRLRMAARERLDKVAAAQAGLPAGILPAFLPLALAPAYLSRMERPDYDPFASVIDLPQWRKQWILWRRARTGRVL